MREGKPINMLGKVWAFFWASKAEQPLVSADQNARPVGEPKMAPMALNEWGTCDEPWLVGKRIIVRDHLTPEMTLDVFIHELLHAAGYALLAEAWVTETASDMTRAILENFEVSQKK